MKAIMLFLAGLLILTNGCEQFISEEDFSKQLTGKVRDTSGKMLSDVKVFIIYNFDHSDTLFKGPDSPTGTFLEQNFPNPFNCFSTFKFYLTDTAEIKADIALFDGTPVLNSAIDEILPAGTYEWRDDLSIELPSNGYVLSMMVKEKEDTTFWERSFIRSYRTYDSSIINTAPNTVTVNGIFELKYNSMPFRQTYVTTLEADPTPMGYCTVNEYLTIVLYKPGFKVYQENVLIKFDRYINKDFVLQPE